ncbi:hypothetical protein P389DRAFT_4196 [Cystobasidium minutum MCA 4210]|uniref:uncharacterized protein n=1 Tax=Cystobasidium minutum MCA 4210 TaxID=1397322 RepID=UPI0034CEEA6E|eukprot:jgi/Rhomi1/4196/CE4195_622
MTAYSAEREKKEASSASLLVPHRHRNNHVGVHEVAGDTAPNRSGQSTASVKTSRDTPTIQRAPSTLTYNSTSSVTATSNMEQHHQQQQNGGNHHQAPSSTARRASLQGGSSRPASTKRKNSNTSLGNAINSALGNDSPNDDLGLLSSEEEDEIDGSPPSMMRRGRTRARSNSSNTAPRSTTTNDGDDEDDYHEESFSGPLHYLPLIVAVVPPLGAVLHGRAEAWTDFLILLLVAFYLYQIVRVPWEIYYASRTRRLNASSVVLTEQEEDSLVPEQIKLRRKAARAELYQNELFALAFCVLSPFVGSYLLYWVRGALSDPDRYINPFNIKLFIMASGVKPWAHFFKLVKNRSLFLQSEVAYPVPTVSILLDQVRELKIEMNMLKNSFATKNDVKTLRDGVDVPLTNLSKAVKRYERKEEYLRLSTEEKFEILHKRQEELLDELIVSNHTIESLRADQERSSSVLRALRYIFSGDGQASATAGRPRRGVLLNGPRNSRDQRGYVWYERGPLFYMFLPLIASNRMMEATGRLIDSLTSRRIGVVERGGMLEDVGPVQSVRFAPDTNRISGSPE